MSEMQDKSFPDYNGYVNISCCKNLGMLTFRGNLLSPAIKKAFGVSNFEPRSLQIKYGLSLGWMAPDELLILCPWEQTTSTLLKLENSFRGEYTLLIDVSDSRLVFNVKGSKVRELIAKLAPIDLAPGAFGPGELRRTRLGQIPSAFWMENEEAFKVVCFRSVAKYMYDQLCFCSAKGSEVGIWN